MRGAESDPFPRLATASEIDSGILMSETESALFQFSRKSRIAAFFMAVAVGSFVYLAADSGVPLWLVVVIGILGAILIAFFIALVWFWLRFLSPSARRKSTDA